jgi:Tol biopolymer transport system component
MPRVVPSQVVDFIDDKFPHARSRQQYNVDPQFRDRVTALIRLVDELPDELLIMDREAYNRFVLSVSNEEYTRPRGLDDFSWARGRAL